MSEPPDAAARVHARAAPRASVGRLRAITLILLGGTTLLLVLLWSLRGALVTALAARALASRGVSCADLSISASPLLAELTVAPATCQVAESEIVSIAWAEPIAVRMEGSALGSLTADTVRIVRHRREGVLTGGLADLLGAPERVGAVLHFASRLSSIDSPRIEISRVEVLVDDQDDVELSLRAITVPAREGAVPVEAVIDEISLASVAGPLGMAASPRLTAVTVRATPDRGTLAGTLDSSVELPMLGTLQLGRLLGEQRVEIEVTGLDGPEPRYAIRTAR